MRKIFRDVLKLEEAIERIYKFYRPIPSYEDKYLLEAVGRVLAEDVFAPIDVPPFDRATMDGYACRAEDTFGADEVNPISLNVTALMEAGVEPKVTIRSGEAVEIATGAVIPKGANAVVKVEDVRTRGDRIEVIRPVNIGENVMFAGSDIMRGELLVRVGTILTHREIGLLAACGINKVKVYKKPKVAVISTGNELVQVGERLTNGKIYDINSYSLSAAIIENGGDPILLGIAKDNREDLLKKLKKGLELADIVVTSGSTSAGAGDLMYKVLDEWEPGVIIHGIAVKPGKPTIVAICDNKLVIGLPGYPTSALTIFELIVAPIIRELSGIKTERRQILKAKLAVKVFSSEGRRELLPVSVVSSAKGYSVYPVTGAYSGSITSLAFSDGFIEIPEDTIMVQSDQEVEVKLYSKLKPSDLIIIGSHCIGIDLILSLMRKKNKFLSKVINVGSTGGILAIKRGEADIAGTHLLDESGEYNLPIIRKYNVKNAVLVKGYLREQGLVTKKGNPKGIKSFEDLIRSDVTFINRNKGSGTRVLIDLNLRKLAEKLNQSFDELIKKICGYEIEAKTHTSVAVAVATGKADVGVAIKSVANLYGLDFIPVRSEEYDFLIARDSLDKEHVKLFIETLTSQEFAKVVEEMGGIKIYERTGEKILV